MLKVFQILTLIWVVVATINSFDVWGRETVLGNFITYNSFPIIGWGIYYILKRDSAKQ